MRLDPEAIQSLVHRDRVHRSLYLDPEVFDLEMHKIFGGTWVYVGHDSLVPKPGDYITTRIGKQPVVLSRHADGEDLRHPQQLRTPRRHRLQRGQGQRRSCSAAAITAGRSRPTATSTPWRCRAATARISTSPIRRSAWARPPRRQSIAASCSRASSPKGPSLDEHLGHAKDCIDELCRPRARRRDRPRRRRAQVHVPRQLEAAARERRRHVPRAVLARIRRCAAAASSSAAAPARIPASAISDRGSAAQRWEQRSAWGSRVERPQLQRPSADRRAAPGRSGVQDLSSRCSKRKHGAGARPIDPARRSATTPRSIPT